MANKSLFPQGPARETPRADTMNEAGGSAYALAPDHALAQLAATGCLGAVYYADAETQLADVVKLASQVDPVMLAKIAVFARQRGFMKDMPALLVAILSVRDPGLFAKVFDRVIDNAKMLRTFVQVIRSGRVGRKSLGTRPKKQILGWLEGQSDEGIFRASVGDAPSLTDVVKMVHPKPTTPSRRALYGYLVGKAHEEKDLPELVRAFEAFRKDGAAPVPDVPLQLLTSLPLDAQKWAQIARRASWQTTRMNLNTFARHGVFDIPGMTELVAARLRDPESIARARVFPYQLLIAYLATRGGTVPRAIADALHDAMELATANVPALGHRTWVLVDVSGSMRSPVTGRRDGATTAVRCVDAAALVAATIVRRNPEARVICFDDKPHPMSVEARDSVIGNAERLAAIGGGGTNTSIALERVILEVKARGPAAEGADLVIYVSDNQSWIDARRTGVPTATMSQWETLKRLSPGAKLVCIDLQPYAHTQAPDRHDILNVGGFSDQVFELIGAFAEADYGTQSGRISRHWLSLVERVEL